ncbi:MAG TPA: hypothetical protein VFE86_06610, partial [Ilumatobacteraceae bacterium]|nr:hypothetical protein [Ilumatobacteraceae bacterium]
MSNRHAVSISAIAVLAVLAVACSDDSVDVSVSGPGSLAPTTVVAPATTVLTTATTATNATTATTPGGTSAPTTTAAPLGEPHVALAEIEGFPKPVEVSFRPTDGLTYVVEQDGMIVMLTNGQPGAVALDMTDLTSADGERGLLGLAVTKDGSMAYVDYTN